MTAGTKRHRLTSGKRTLWIVLGALLVVLVLVVVGYQVAARIAKEQLVRALGPHAHWASMEVGVFSVVITDLSVDAMQGWPVEQEFNVKSVVITPRLDSLIRRRPVVVSEVVVSGGNATLLRDTHGLKVLPVLLRAGSAPAPDQGDETRLLVEKIRFENIKVDFYDETVAPKNFKITLYPVAGVLADLKVPVVQSVLQLSFAAPVLSPEGNPSGDFSLTGEVRPHEGSDLRVLLQGVGVKSVGSYLAKAGETGVTGGTVDLTARSVVNDGALKADGVLTLHDLQIESKGGLASTVLGLPRDAVLSSLKDRKGDIVLHFTIAGNVHDPKFSLNEAAATRITAAAAEALGLPIENIAKGVGSLGEQGLDAAGHVVGGVGNAITGIFKH